MTTKTPQTHTLSLIAESHFLVWHAFIVAFIVEARAQGALGAMERAQTILILGVRDYDDNLQSRPAFRYKRALDTERMTRQGLMGCLPSDAFPF